MKITDIKIATVEIPLKKPFVTSLRRADYIESIVVCIETDRRLFGYGETAPTEAITGDSRHKIIQTIYKLRKLLIGLRVDDKEGILTLICSLIGGANSAKSAIEIALYDIWAQKSDLPLYKYLGGTKNRFKTCTTISLNTVDEMVSDAANAIGHGFDSLKIKLGDSYMEDIERVINIWHVAKSRASLKLDANQGWSKKETVKFLTEIQNRGIAVELIEQPVPKDDLAGLKYIKKRTGIPILADESVFVPEDAERILGMDAVDMVNIKLDKCGGITKALQIADICHDYGIKCMMGCMLEGSISVGAAAHTASARSDTITMYDLDAPALCQTLPVNGGTVFDGADIIIPENAGLGIESISELEWI